ncbi:PREDICTED: uncharacterized protein LOC109331915 isoform X2 [Lupinus angustifolius]|uniref:uncharacterized protein LOC109331915 isoform X2 n=1 Tax=Lupinus angustifolius TaxID=3871 RepID=UPI00092FB65D|nr:PREDICTED: uncharacterized protein LOC109331915 isoform X2 [Lupinus angustifolius]
MGNHLLLLSLTLLFLFFNLSVSAAPSTTSPATFSRRSMMKFESGYNVETVFDGSKLGVEPYAVEVLPNGELLILDSANSNVYRISSSLSSYSRPKLVAGSSGGYSGHVDGKVREARMNHPKGITVDDRGNIYVADTANMAIRKISDSGVTTIAGGKSSRGRGHVDGPSEEARFSDDFDVVYVGSSCSLLVIDRGSQAIREIHLRFDDCAYQYGSGFPLGIAMLVLAGFFGYMLALLQRRLGTLVTIQDAQTEVPVMSNFSPSLHQKPLQSVRPTLIQSESEPDKLEDFFRSSGKFIANFGESMVEIMGGLLPGFRKTPQNYLYEREPLLQQPQKQQVNAWPVQDSFVIPDEDEPPSIDERTPTPRKTYAFMSKDAEKMQQLRQSKAFYSGWDGDLQQKQQQQKYNHRHEYRSSIPHTYYEQSHETNNEIIFGAVQEQDAKQKSVVIKPVEYGASMYEHCNIRSRMSSMDYNYKY